MKLLLFSDLHAHSAMAENLVCKAADVDVVIGAGDIGHLRRNLEEAIRSLSSIECPSVLVPGNSESWEELQQACRTHWPKAQVLHGTGTEIDGVSFFGIGGGIPTTPFGAWSWDFTEEEAQALLAPCPAGGILVSHSPPSGILDVSSSGRHLGSTTLRTVLEEKTPRLLVCGHIHDSSGRSEQIGSTLVVNAGPGGIVVDLDEFPAAI